ncbi:MAG: hypothetical protein LBR58_05235 [Propionibacteriaceae bacterium]|nr:hypothetical protein [Propionibacteriaceae bacterium]
MSRAFITEGDGWFYCRDIGDTCCYADENGRCILPECEILKDWLAGDDDEDE